MSYVNIFSQQISVKIVPGCWKFDIHGDPGGRNPVPQRRRRRFPGAPAIRENHQMADFHIQGQFKARPGARLVIAAQVVRAQRRPHRDAVDRHGGYGCLYPFRHAQDAVTAHRGQPHSPVLDGAQHLLRLVHRGLAGAVIGQERPVNAARGLAVSAAHDGDHRRAAHAGLEV